MGRYPSISSVGFHGVQIHAGRDAFYFFKDPGKIERIVIANRVGNVGYGQVRISKQGTGPVDTKPGKIIVGGDPQMLDKYPVKMATADSDAIGDAGDVDRMGVIVLDILERIFNINAGDVVFFPYLLL